MGLQNYTLFNKAPSFNCRNNKQKDLSIRSSVVYLDVSMEKQLCTTTEMLPLGSGGVGFPISAM